MSREPTELEKVCRLYGDDSVSRGWLHVFNRLCEDGSDPTDVSAYLMTLARAGQMPPTMKDEAQ